MCLDVTKSGNGERGTENGERESGNECTAVFRITIQNGMLLNAGTGNGERESGNECTAVFRITIQNGGRRKRRTRTISVQVFVGEGFTS